MASLPVDLLEAEPGNVLQRARPMTNASDHRLLIDAPMESDIDDDLKNATSLLVERVPLPAEYYDRSSEPFGFTAFKIGTNELVGVLNTAEQRRNRI